MCLNTSLHSYNNSKKTLEGLFPEVEWKDQIICEKCAKRETGNKYWKEIKRNKKGQNV